MFMLISSSQSIIQIWCWRRGGRFSLGTDEHTTDSDIIYQKFSKLSRETAQTFRVRQREPCAVEMGSRQLALEFVIRTPIHHFPVIRLNSKFSP